MTDAEKIKAILDHQQLAWNNGDADAYANHFAENGSFTNILGSYYTGISHFREKHHQVFRTIFHKSSFDYQLISLRFIRPDIALAETQIRVSDFRKAGPFKFIHTNEEGILVTSLLQVFSKTGNEWRIEAYHNTDLKLGSENPDLNL